MEDRQNASEAFVDVYAESTIGPMEAKLRTMRKFLACWNLELIPYTSEVVYCLGPLLNCEGTDRRTSICI